MMKRASHTSGVVTRESADDDCGASTVLRRPDAKIVDCAGTSGDIEQG
jgi:hypothetical protein